MLVFQVFGLFSTILPRLIKICGTLFKLVVRLIKGKTPADKFADVVMKAMKTHPPILERKYADRWMVRVLQKGLNGRELMPYEVKQTVLPFKMPTLG